METCTVNSLLLRNFPEGPQAEQLMVPFFHLKVPSDSSLTVKTCISEIQIKRKSYKVYFYTSVCILRLRVLSLDLTFIYNYTVVGIPTSISVRMLTSPSQTTHFLLVRFLSGVPFYLEPDKHWSNEEYRSIRTNSEL